jgi:DNA-binding transcriptional ArsR family regulator
VDAVIELRFTAADLARVRFARSPMQELVTSMRVLSAPRPAGMHQRWARAARPGVRALPVDLLRALIGSWGYLPDFLVPTPDRLDATFDTELARVRAAPADFVRAELDLIRGAAPLAPELRRLYDDPDRELGTVADQLVAYWRAAVEPVWPRLRSLLDADLDHRTAQLAAHGVGHVLDTLHREVQYADETLRIQWPNWTVSADLCGRGLLLVPCAFAWPGLMLAKDTDPPMLSYAPRGVGRVWAGTPNGPKGSEWPLARLLGRTRAALLAHLDLPLSTTQLAARLGLTTAAVSEHLSVLRQAELVTSRRAGRSVLYRRTPLADGLVAAGGDEAGGDEEFGDDERSALA